MVTTRGEGGWEQLDEGKEGINGDWVVNTQYNIQMMYYKVVHLKPNNFINQSHSNKFNLKILTNETSIKNTTQYALDDLFC